MFWICSSLELPIDDREHSQQLLSDFKINYSSANLDLPWKSLTLCAYRSLLCGLFISIDSELLNSGGDEYISADLILTGTCLFTNLYVRFYCGLSDDWLAELNTLGEGVEDCSYCRCLDFKIKSAINESEKLLVRIVGILMPLTALF